MKINHRSKHNVHLFVCSILSWLLAWGFTRVVSPYVAQFYRGTGATPSTLSTCWQLVPWLAIIGLLIDYWIVARCQAEGLETNRHVVVSTLLSCGLVSVFIFFTFRPLIIMVQ
jgi:hypothetical protein